MTTGIYPGATYRPIPNLHGHPGEPAHLHEVAGKFPHPPIGWILHVVVGYGSPYNTFVGAKPPQRRFSTGWVAKDGRVEQYAPAEYKSWAQGEGNPLYWSWETEGVPTEPLTDAQVHALAAIHNWLGAPDALASTPGQPGVGTHSMGGVAWGGHACPDPAGREGKGPRSLQRAAILTTAKQLRKPKPPTPPTPPGDDMALTDADVKRIAQAVWGSEYGPTTARVTTLQAVSDARRDAAAALAAVTALQAKVDAEDPTPPAH